MNSFQMNAYRIHRGDPQSMEQLLPSDLHAGEACVHARRAWGGIEEGRSDATTYHQLVSYKERSHCTNASVSCAAPRLAPAFTLSLLLLALGKL